MLVLLLAVLAVVVRVVLVVVGRGALVERAEQVRLLESGWVGWVGSHYVLSKNTELEAEGPPLGVVKQVIG